MRLSNGVARLENGIAALGRIIGRAGRNTGHAIARTAHHARDTLASKHADLKVELAARQVLDTSRRMAQLPDSDRVLVELRAQELVQIEDTARVRRQEMALRRDLAKRVLRGEVQINVIRPENASCSPQPSSPSLDSGC